MIELVNAAVMRESDAATIAGGVSGRELMLRAARGVMESYAWHGTIAIVCGSGNNAGDGYALAELLFRAGHTCRVLRLGDKCSADGAYYLSLCERAGVEISFFSEATDLCEYDVIVDCMFGTGFSGVPTGMAKIAIERINASCAKVISVDINSGLSATSGEGTLCVRSDVTVSIGTRKYGHYLGDAKDAIGFLRNVDIGIAVAGHAARLVEAEDVRKALGTRKQNSHKGSYGYVALLGGCTEYMGATKLAAMSCAALRAGCGVATLAVPASTVGAVSPQLLESTLYPMPDGDGAMRFSTDALDRLCERNVALAVGMGWGRQGENAEILRYLLETKALRLIIDADGLYALSTLPEEVLKNTRCSVVLTPHMGEFSRLCGIPAEEISHDPVAHAEAYAARTGVVLLLKGAATVITDGMETYLSDRGCAGMATAGSGDVLSGVLCGLLGSRDVTPRTVAAGAYLAGRAGELAAIEKTEIAMLASDTVAMLPAAIKEILSA